MELNKQVVSLELSKKLKELGVKQESLYWWWEWEYNHQTYWLYDHIPNNEVPYFSAFTVAELGELLGSEHKLVHQNGGKIYCYKLAYNFNASTEADCRAKMLIYLIENKLIEHGEGN